MTIHRLGHLALTVTDLDKWTHFVTHNVGLRETGRDGNVAYFTSNARHHQLRLEQGDAYGCSAVGFDVADAAGLDAITMRASNSGLDVEVLVDRHHIGRTARFTVPNGPTFEICLSPEAVEQHSYSTLGARPRKLGHVTLSAPDIGPLEPIAEDVLGFRLSDRLPLGDFADGDLTWYRCNPDHHCLGLTPGPAGVHHYAWELKDISAMAGLADHLTAQDIRYIWGPGRHGPGDNIFSYFEDPEGGMVEVYTDMLQITDDATYVMPKWSGVEEAGNLWGPMPDPRWFEYVTPYESAQGAALAQG